MDVGVRVAVGGGAGVLVGVGVRDGVFVGDGGGAAWVLVGDGVSVFVGVEGAADVLDGVVDGLEVCVGSPGRSVLVAVGVVADGDSFPGAVSSPAEGCGGLSGAASVSVSCGLASSEVSDEPASPGSAESPAPVDVSSRFSAVSILLVSGGSDSTQGGSCTRGMLQAERARKAMRAGIKHFAFMFLPQQPYFISLFLL